MLRIWPLLTTSPEATLAQAGVIKIVSELDSASTFAPFRLFLTQKSVLSCWDASHAQLLTMAYIVPYDLVPNTSPGPSPLIYSLSATLVSLLLLEHTRLSSTFRSLYLLFLLLEILYPLISSKPLFKEPLNEAFPDHSTYNFPIPFSSFIFPIIQPLLTYYITYWLILFIAIRRKASWMLRFFSILLCCLELFLAYSKWFSM